MKTSKKLAIALSLLLVGATVAESAFAQRHYRGGPRVSIGFGFGYGAPYYPYYPRYSYYSPYSPYYGPYYGGPVVVQQPPVYVEQQQFAPAPMAQPQAQIQPIQPQVQPQQPSGYWYYCQDSGGYYPYVKDCAGGWQRVSPQPG